LIRETSLCSNIEIQEYTHAYTKLEYNLVCCARLKCCSLLSGGGRVHQVFVIRNLVFQSCCDYGSCCSCPPEGRGGGGLQPSQSPLKSLCGGGGATTLENLRASTTQSTLRRPEEDPPFCNWIDLAPLAVPIRSLRSLGRVLGQRGQSSGTSSVLR